MALKFPFSIRTLEERLSLEKSWLIKFNKVLSDGENGFIQSPNWKEFAEENIKSCEHRVAELLSTIEELKKIEKMK